METSCDERGSSNHILMLRNLRRRLGVCFPTVAPKQQKDKVPEMQCSSMRLTQLAKLSIQKLQSLLAGFEREGSAST